MRRSLLGFVLVGLVAACQALGTAEPTGMPRATPSSTVLSLAGVSPACSVAFQEAIAGYEDDPEAWRAFTIVANQLAVLSSCPSLEELLSADQQLGVGWNWTSQVELSCRAHPEPDLMGSAICLSLPEEETPTATGVPTATPLSAFEAEKRTRCEQGKPVGLYALTNGVAPAEDSTVGEGVHLVLLEFKDLDGNVGPVPAVERGYIYDLDAPIVASEPGEISLLACIALRAVERETWGTRGQFGTVNCPCVTVDASDAIFWMVDPADGRLVGQPWLRHPIDVETFGTRMILAGVDGPGVRPPEPEDIVADMEAFLGF